MQRPLLLPFLLLAAWALTACGEQNAARPAHVSENVVSDGPVPATAPADAWGESVADLALRLEVPATAFAASDLPVFRVHARNAGSSPLKLSRFEDQTWWYHVTFENLEDGPDFLGGAGLFVDFAEPPDATLEPGATWTQEADLTQERRRFLRIIPKRKPGDDWDYRDELPPGRYRAWVEYVHGGGAGAEYWKGKVRSNVVEVTVTE